MKANALHEFFHDDRGRHTVTRIVYVYNILLAFYDEELPDKDVYYLLQSQQHTAWHDYSFFHVSKKRNLQIPANTEEAVLKEIAQQGLQTPEETIRDYLWNNFRVGTSDGVEEIQGASDIIVFRSKEYDANTACLLKYYNVRLSTKEMSKLVQNPHTMPFSVLELRAMAAYDQFANAVQLWFASDNGARLSRARIHTVDSKSTHSENLTVLFSDMRDFSEMVKATYQVFKTERALQEFRVLCKRYQLVMCRTIRIQGGEIIHTAGDAFVAVFRGADAAKRALVAARNMLASAVELQKNTDFKKLTDSFVTRIGLATGNAQFGYIGPYEMKERTAFGECINIGSRLEGAVKQYSPTGGILLTADTAEKIQDFNKSEFQELAISVKEISENLKCYLLRWPPTS